MSEIAKIISREEKINAAYKDPLRQIAAIIPYLSQRHETAKKMIEVYAGNIEAEAQLFSIIEALNKDIAALLGLEH